MNNEKENDMTYTITYTIQVNTAPDPSSILDAAHEAAVDLTAHLDAVCISTTVTDDTSQSRKRRTT